MPTGPKNSITDIKGLRVGCAEDAAAKTGVTLLLPEGRLRAAVDVRGGAPGTRETDTLRPGALADEVHGIVLSGGSVYGLAAADSVCRILGAAGRGYGMVQREGVPQSPIVPAAILYDLANDGDKAWGTEPPYAALGEAAYHAASDDVPLGNAGAGLGATAGAYPGGLGTASWVTEDGFTVAALVAANPFGSPYVPGTNQFWAAPFEVGAEFGGRGFPSEASASGLPPDTKMGTATRSNTTVAIVATDADLPVTELERFAIMAQDGLARAIRPAHAPVDGDVVFAVTTAAKKISLPMFIASGMLGTIAGDVLARAIARGVYAAKEG
ncbi:MAG: P1 family peptidase [Pseudomonadota bacterium]